MKQYTFYPGCAYDSSGLPIKLSIESTNPLLGIELVNLEDWTCCGCPGAAISELGGLALATRNLALAEKMDRDLVSACSCCYRNLLNAHLTYTTDARIRAKLSEALAVANLKYTGHVRVRGLVDVYVNDIGIELISSKVKKKLTGLKVACWYGCHQTRPFGPDDSENPQWMDWVVTALGAEPVQYPLKTQCCGGAELMSDKSMVVKLNQKLLNNAVKCGAQAMVTTLCPLCFTNLDAFQGQFTSETGNKFNMPIIALSQIMGVAFGLSFNALGLDKNVTPIDKILAPYFSLVTEARA
jgi:heterodisulfide reductase subunit B2